MEVIESGLEAIRGGVGCPCICTNASVNMDSEGLEVGGCGCQCSYLSFDTFCNNVANQTMSYDYG